VSEVRIDAHKHLLISGCGLNRFGAATADFSGTCKYPLPFKNGVACEGYAQTSHWIEGGLMKGILLAAAAVLALPLDPAVSKQLLPVVQQTGDLYPLRADAGPASVTSSSSAHLTIRHSSETCWRRRTPGLALVVPGPAKTSRIAQAFLLGEEFIAGELSV